LSVCMACGERGSFGGFVVRPSAMSRPAIRNLAMRSSSRGSSRSARPLRAALLTCTRFSSRRRCRDIRRRSACPACPGAGRAGRPGRRTQRHRRPTRRRVAGQR
jgi:hypothetical protein